MRSLLFISWLLLATVAVAAEEPAVKIDACTLLSKAEAEEVVGGKIKEPQRTGAQDAQPKADAPAISNCTFASAEQTGSMPGKSIFLWVRRAPAAVNDSQNALDAFRRDPQSKNPRDVVALENLGDAAFWISGKQGTQPRVELNAMKKDLVVQVILTGFDDAIAAQAKGREVINKVFEKTGVNK